MKKRSKKRIRYGILILLSVYLAACFSLRFSVRETALDALEENGCMLYYIVNTDGMKGLGHSVVMIVDCFLYTSRCV